MKDQPTVGIVGAGTIAGFHLRGFAESGTPVRIIADVNAEAVKPYLQQFGADHATEWEQVVKHSDVDVVVICTPSSTHYVITKAALEQGKHVICEKTLTLSPDESLELARLAEAKDLQLYTDYMKRFFPASQKAKELVPELGHIMDVHCLTYQAQGINIHTGPVPAAFTPGPDGASPIMKTSGGGALICGGSHTYDLLLYLIGQPTAVYARSFIRPGHDVDFMHHALFDLPSGGFGHFEVNWHPLKKIGYEGRGWDEIIQINGVDGRLILQTPVWNEPERNPAQLRYYDNRTEQWTDFAFDAVCAFAAADRHFLQQIAAGEQGPHDRYVGYRADMLLEMSRQSAAAGQRLEIPWAV